MTIKHLTARLLILLALGLSACAVPPPEAPPIPQTPAADRNILAGKVVCLDAGHGGTEDGALGPTGLREADANLAVTFALRDLLQQSGATVVLTRDDDRTLALDKRVALNIESKTDAFVSLHHNASGSPEYNRSEVYYQHKEYNGPSEDLADELLRQFEMLYGFPKSRKLVAYSYHVLRENEGPAVLGEPAYITDPYMEMRMRRDEHVQAQALAYYRALLAFFAKGTPRITFSPIPAAPQFVQARLIDSRSAIDPTSITLTLDGRPLRYDYNADARTLTSASIAHIAGGSHTVVLHCANLNGNRSAWARQSFFVHREAQSVRMEVSPAERGGVRRIVIFVTDEAGRAVADGVPVRAEFAARFLHAEKETRDGTACCYLPASASGTVTVRAAGLTRTVDLNTGQSSSVRTGFVLDSRTGLGVPGCGLRADGMRTDRNGWFFIPTGDEPPIVQAPGYDAVAGITGNNNIYARARFSGLLQGKRIFIDPELGGDDAGGINAQRVRAADANLNTARCLRDYLRWAGADPVLSRDDDRTMDMPTRARVSLDEESDLYLAIAHIASSAQSGYGTVRVNYRWQSAIPWATAMSPVIAGSLGMNDGGAQHLVTQALMHANDQYRAVQVALADINAPSATAELSSPARSRREALAILFGLVEAFAVERHEKEPAWQADRHQLAGTISDASTSAPLAGALVNLNDGLAAQTGSDGRYEFRYLAPGEHALNVIAAGYNAKQVTVQISGETTSLPIALAAGSIDAATQ